MSYNSGKLSWGLIGAGDIVKKRVAPALNQIENCEFVSVARAKSNLAEGFAKEFGVKKWFENWQELIKDDAIDAVYIATPVYLHARQTIAAAEVGKHILCEKPMALSVHECDEMISAAKANDVKLGISYYRRFYPIVAKIKEIIDNGEIGKVILSFIKAFESFNPVPDAPRSWLLEKEKSGGGPMFDFGCHRIELLQYLLGKIAGVESVVDNILFKRNVEDTASVIFKFENSSQGILSVTHAVYDPSDNFEIYGTKGSIHINNLNKGDITIINSLGEKSEIIERGSNSHIPLIQDFTQAILRNQEPSVTGETGREVNRILEKIYNNI